MSPPGKPDVVLDDVAVERPKVESRDGSDHHQEDRDGGEQRSLEPARRVRRDELGERSGSREMGEEKGSERPGELLGGTGQTEHRPRGHHSLLPGQKNGDKDHRDEDHVVGTEDLLPPGERVERGQGHGNEACVVPTRQEEGQARREGVEEQAHQTRIEEAQETARDQIAGQHHEMGAGQVGVVPKDGVAAEGLPEGGGSGLPSEDGLRVVRAVRALPLQDLLHRERELHDAAVLPVGPVGGRPESDEGQGRHDHEEDAPHRDEGEPEACARAREAGEEVHEREPGGAGGQGERYGVAVERRLGVGIERPQPGRRVEESRLVKKPPGQHAGWIVVDELTGQKEKKARNDRDVEARASGLAQPIARPAPREAAC